MVSSVKLINDILELLKALGIIKDVDQCDKYKQIFNLILELFRNIIDEKEDEPEAPDESIFSEISLQDIQIETLRKENERLLQNIERLERRIDMLEDVVNSLSDGN